MQMPETHEYPGAQVVPSSTEPLQLSSLRLHTSGEGSTSPTQGPQAPPVQVWVPDLQTPVQVQVPPTPPVQPEQVQPVAPS